MSPIRGMTAALVLVLATAGWAADRVYVGADVCRDCHASGHRDQWSRWISSAHARAWADLAAPESLEIARLSGIHTNPFTNPVCLGCHATASDTEDWQRDPAFDLADGVQCELCHGPGSDYIEAEIMADPERAAAAGLRTPGPETCLVCHKEKGSHTAVLDPWPFDVEEAMRIIAHPGRGGDLPAPRETDRPPDREFAGHRVCATCHDGPDGAYLAAGWRLTGHATAWASLTTEEGRRIAAETGVGDPASSPECLRCHGTATRTTETIDPTRGVQCESCHGGGAAHAADPEADLPRQPRSTCVECHRPGIHDTAFDQASAMPLVDHTRPTIAQASAAEMRYKTPFNLVVDPTGRRLYVACEASDSLVVVNTVTRSVEAEIAVGKLPHGVGLSPSGDRVYVSNRGDDTVSVVDAEALEVLDTIPVGDEPHGLTTDATGGVLYVANAGSYDVSVVDLEKGRETRRLAAARGAWDIARSADDATVIVTNNLSHYVPFRATSRSELTLIDTGRSTVRHRVMVPDANLIQGVATARDIDFAVVTLIRTKNLIPMTRIMQGWVMTNGFGILWPDGRVDQLLLDEPERYFADPTDVAVTPDGTLAFVTGGGIDAVAVIDLTRVVDLLEGADPVDRERVLPNHTGIPTEFSERITVGRNPRGIAVSPDGRWVYVAEALADTVGVIDVERRERVAEIDLGGPDELTLARRGESIFHSADVTFGGQFSCHSCHPDGGIDGITYDIEPDGIGLNPVDNRSLRGILDTAPFKWTGKNPSLARQCGPRLAVFFTRIDPFTPDQVTALERYIQTIPRNPNRYRGIGEELSPAQRRGKAIFERAHDNSGNELTPLQKCSSCHSGPYFTSREKVSVGTGSELDTHSVFDVPHLNNIYESAPYLHDGRAETLEEIWTVFNPKDEHGVTNDMTKDQLNDLIEYLKTL